jgi:hypothetical protein
MPPMITPEILATLTPEFRAILLTVIIYYKTRIAQLEQEIGKGDGHLFHSGIYCAHAV